MFSRECEKEWQQIIVRACVYVREIEEKVNESIRKRLFSKYEV